MTHPTEDLLNCLACAAGAFAPFAFRQSVYAEHSVRIIVPSEAGGGSNFVFNKGPRLPSLHSMTWLTRISPAGNDLPHHPDILPGHSSPAYV